MLINILDWDITYDEFVDWVSRNDAVVDAVTGFGPNSRGMPGTTYVFQDEDDFVNFKLTFAKEK